MMNNRTEAYILLKRVYDLSKSVPNIPCTHPVFEDIEDYLVCKGIAELNEGRKEMFVTKSMCEFCKVRFSGCEYQYDSEDCRRDRKDYRIKDIDEIEVTEEKGGFVVMKKKKIYVICPVRNQDKKQGKILTKYIRDLELENIEVFYPMRDAPQKSETGYEIIDLELQKIKEADEVHVLWDVNSKGSHFDLGMAYALNKKIVFVHLFEKDNDGKSYVKAIKKYMEQK